VSIAENQVAVNCSVGIDAVMFALLRGFYDEVTHVPERRVVLLGVESAGKTAILECLKLFFVAHGGTASKHIGLPALPSSKLSGLSPTVGLNVARLPTGQENLLIWDLGGAKALRPIWQRYVADAEALIWVVDAASEADALDDSRDCLRGLLQEPSLLRAPLLVFASKQDLPDAMDPVKTSLALDLLSDAELRPQCVQPCSAKTGAGVCEGIDWLVDRIRHPESNIKTSIKELADLQRV
jgi:GTPase SAR1 family protein